MSKEEKAKQKVEEEGKTFLRKKVESHTRKRPRAGNSGQEAVATSDLSPSSSAAPSILASTDVTRVDNITILRKWYTVYVIRANGASCLAQCQGKTNRIICG